MQINDDSWLVVRRPELDGQPDEGWALMVPESGSVYWSTATGDVWWAPLYVVGAEAAHERAIAYPEVPDVALADRRSATPLLTGAMPPGRELELLRYIARFCQALEVIGQRLEATRSGD